MVVNLKMARGHWEINLLFTWAAFKYWWWEPWIPSTHAGDRYSKLRKWIKASIHISHPSLQRPCLPWWIMYLSNMWSKVEYSPQYCVEIASTWDNFQVKDLRHVFLQLFLLTISRSNPDYKERYRKSVFNGRRVETEGWHQAYCC